MLLRRKGGAVPAIDAGPGLWFAVIVLATATSLASLRYLVGADMVPGPLQENFVENRTAFLIHIALGSTALLIGPWQFLTKLRQRRPGLHRALGRLYAVSCVLGGLAGLTIAPGSNGGPLAAAGFAALALLWIGTTAIAVSAAIRGDFASHQRWMIRSFALILAGVTLRLYLPVAIASGEGFAQVYAMIAWLCWVPNLCVALWLTRASRQ